MEYEFAQLTSTTGLNIYLHVSSLPNARVFANILQPGFGNNGYYRETRYSNTNTLSNAYSSVNNKLKIAYEIIGVPLNATPGQIRAAYLQLAKMYHPDSLSGLAPEFVDMAQERIKEINEAYEQLKRK